MVGFRIILKLVLILFSFASWAMPEAPKDLSQQIQFKVVKYKLENGLTVLLHEDHSAPIISFQQWFRVGSRDEKPGRTGLAHFFEHLMFKGTKKYTGDFTQRELQANGGSNNAFTTRDFTGYYENIPSGKLEFILDFESDRMRNLLFKLKEIQSEREVVKEERRYRYDNSVMGYLSEALYKTVFKVHPYRWSVIGSMRDLNAASIKDFKNFYNVYYAPNNAVVVIAGDFQLDKTKKLIKKYFAPLKAQTLPKRNYSPEPKQNAHREVTLEKPVQNPTIAVAYRSVQAGTDEAFALDLASTILGDGTSSRLHRKEVYKRQRALSVSVWNYTPMDPGIFEVVASVKPGVDENKVLNSIYKEVFRLRTELVSSKELQKAKNITMSSLVNRLKTVSGKARALAASEIVYGDYTKVFSEIQKYNEVTAEQIKAAAEKYLKPKQRSVIRVIPSKKQGA